MILLPPRAEELVEKILSHGDSVYDAAKSHEYYMRNRKLKGRSKGSADTTSTSSTTSSGPSAAQRASAKSEARQQKVASIRGKMSKMSTHLEGLIAKRDGAKETTSDTKSKTSATKSASKSGSTSAESTPDKKLSVSEKADKAKKAREDYEKVDDKSSAETATDLDKEIAETRARITQLKTQLREILDRAKAERAR